MKIALVGSRWFGTEVLKDAVSAGHVVEVFAPSGTDRLAAEAARLGCALYSQCETDMRRAGCRGGIDLVIAAHAHCRVPPQLRAACPAIGYHPSLLPLHRGRNALEATIAAGDRVAGGSVYLLEEQLDAGAIVFQDFCFVQPGDDASTLWRRDLAPLGLELLTRAVDHIAHCGHLPDATPQVQLLAA